MVYKVINPDDYNSKYTEILKTCFKYSDHFGFSTIKYIHKNEHSNEYFEFLKNLEPFEISADGFETPRYSRGQKLHFYTVNKLSAQIICNTSDFDVWNAYDYPADLVFYFKKRPWFRCISHERIILINTINKEAVEKLGQLNLSFRMVDDTNNI